VTALLEYFDLCTNLNLFIICLNLFRYICNCCLLFPITSVQCKWFPVCFPLKRSKGAREELGEGKGGAVFPPLPRSTYECWTRILIKYEGMKMGTWHLNAPANMVSVLIVSMMYVRSMWSHMYLFYPHIPPILNVSHECSYKRLQDVAAPLEAVNIMLA